MQSGDDRELQEALDGCASPEVSVARAAVELVARTIAEGGQLVPATPRAVPAIAALLARDDVRVKRELAEVMTLIIDAVDEVRDAGVLDRIQIRFARLLVPAMLRESVDDALASHRASAAACAPLLSPELRARVQALR